MDEPTTLYIRQFGRFEVRRGDVPLPPEAWGRRKTKALLKVLLTERGRAFSSDQLTDWLFPDLDPQNALVNLRGRVGELRAALEPHLARKTDSQYVLTVEGGGYAFSAEAPCWVDTEAFEAHVRTARDAQAREDWPAARAGWDAAVALRRGDYLSEDLYEEWSQSPRERLRELFHAALEGQARAELHLGCLEQAIERAQALLEADPLREAGYRLLMRAHFHGGDQGHALQAYEACRRALSERLGADPSPQTQALFEEIRAGRLAPLVPMGKALHAIAVLPFEHRGGGAEAEYFGDGLTEDIIIQLSRLRALKVISRASVMRFKGNRPPLERVARELGVGAVLEGSVRRAGGRVRVSASLSAAHSGETLWAERYDRELTDIFAIQSDVARNIVRALRAEISAQEGERLSRVPTADPEAYQRYLRGRFFLNRSTEPDYGRAIEQFRAAVERDPDYALAYAGMAETFNCLAFFNFLSPEEGYLKGKEAALKALEIDDAVGEAHAALGNVKLFFEWDWEAAARALRRAIALSPGHTTAHAEYARYLLYMGRTEEAVRVMEDTLDLDPLSMNLNRDLGYTYLFAGEYERALAQFAKANELYPEDRFAHFLRGLVHLLRDEYEPMEAAFETARTAAAGKDPYLALCLAAGRAIAAARQGRTARARELADQLEALDQPRALAALLATVHHALGDDDRAFRWLERAYEARDPWLCHLKVWPVAEATRRDPRFQDLLRRLNLPRDE